MKRAAQAIWRGSLKEGKGSLSTESQILNDALYSFSTRFGEAKGTNPEELIAAAHAGCFSMALAAQLGGMSLVPERIETHATVQLEKLPLGFSITAVHLEVTAKVPLATAEMFESAANYAKANCPVSKLLNASITLQARLET